MKLKKKICASALCFVCAFVMLLGATALPKKNPETFAENVTVSFEENNALKETYALGDTLKIPSAKLEQNGSTYPSEGFILYAPDGKAYTSDSYALTEAGVYKVVYFADGKKIKAEKTFSVKTTTYTVTSDASTAEYVEKLELGEGGGLKLSIKDGEVFTYNEPVDLAKNGDDFLKFFTYSCNDKIDGRRWKSEVTSLMVTLTDCYDADNYVVFELHYMDHNNKGDMLPYYRVGANGQRAGGWEENYQTEATGKNAKEVFVEGKRYRVNFNYGIVSGDCSYDIESFSESRTEDGKWNWDGKTFKPWNGAFTLSYDVETNRVYVKDGVGLKRFKDESGNESFTGTQTKRFIGDPSNTDLYENNTFKGFTTGEVYVSIKGDMYYESAMNVEIESIAGKTGESLKPADQTDTQAPVIKIENDKTSAYVAAGERFTLYAASAADVNLIGEVKTAVYRNYGKADQTQIPVENGTFLPDKVAIYTVVYYATDSFGNVGEKTFEVYSVKTENGKSIDFTTAHLTGLKAGETVVLPEYVAKGLNGDVSVKIYAECATDGEKTEIDSETREFVATKAGQYKITFNYGDGVKEYSYSYDVVAKSSEVVRFFGEPSLPLYFIKNAPYTLEPFYVYTFEDAASAARLPDLYVSEDGGEYKKIDFDEYTVNASSTVRFKYVYGETEYVGDEISVIDAKINEGIDYTAYFAGNVDRSIGYTANDGKKLDNGVFIKSKTKRGSTSFEFINALDFNSFATEFEIPEDVDGFERLDIEIIDCDNRENILKITYKKAEMKKSGVTNVIAALLIDDARETWKNSVVFANNKHTVSYNSSLNILRLDNVSFDCPETFKAEKVFVKFTISGISEESGIFVSKINNQVFSNFGGDYAAPTAKIKKSCGVWEKNDVVTIYSATATDVLTSVLKKNIRVKVTLPDRSVAKDENGVALDGTTLADKDYKVKLTAYGDYLVTYTAEDFFGNTFSHTYVMTVADKVAPALVIDKGYDENTVVSVKFGDTVKVANVTCSDDVTTADKLTLIITAFAPDGSCVSVTDGTFNATVKGLWRISYLCADEAGNIASRYYNVRVN